MGSNLIIEFLKVCPVGREPNDPWVFDQSFGE